MNKRSRHPTGVRPFRSPGAVVRSAAVAAALAVAATACGSGPGPEAPPAPPEAPAREPAPVEPGEVPAVGPYAPGIDVLHYHVELDLRRAPSGLLEGTTRVRFRRSPDTESLVLDLTGLAVDSVRLGGGRGDGLRRVDRTAYDDSLDAGRLPVPLPESASGADTLVAVVHYRGSPDDGMILGETPHGRSSAFADNWPDRARFWFPSVDHPSDKATATFVVRAPESWQVVANGAALAPPTPVRGQAEDAGRGRTWRWGTEAPIPTYTMVVGATEFEVRQLGLAACDRAPRSPRTDGCIEVSTWLLPQDTARAAPSFRRAVDMVDFFSRVVGPYPYEKLANVQAATRFGGMENASAVFYSAEALARGQNLESTVAHEIAHQWFGDSVTEADWRHLWLSEGFAEYFEALFFEDADGVEAFRERMEADRRAYLSSGAARRPVIDEEVDDLFDLLNANNYQKGGWVLHMLRGVVGDPAFLQGVRLYYERHRDGTALTEDFRRAVEEASDRDLTWFFDQWLREPGHPVIATDWTWDDDGGRLRVELRQVQPDGWPTFRVPAEVEIRFGDGEARREPVELLDRSTELVVELPTRPDSVVFDPDGWVLSARPNGEAPPTPDGPAGR